MQVENVKLSARRKVINPNFTDFRCILGNSVYKLFSKMTNLYGSLSLTKKAKFTLPYRELVSRTLGTKYSQFSIQKCIA